MKYHPEYAVIIGKINDDGSVYEGGLMRHTKAAVGIARCMIETETFQNICGFESGEPKELYADITYAALILHDCCKPDDTEKHSTRFDHPILAAKLFKDTAKTYINESNMETMKFVIPKVYGCIASHMGEWTTAPYAKGVVLPKPKNGLETFVHMCDYLASRKFLIFDFDVYDPNSRG